MHRSVPAFRLFINHRLCLAILLLAVSTLSCDRYCDIINPSPAPQNFALHFDGENDFVWIPDRNGSLDLTDFTIICWIQFEKRGKIHELVVKDAEGEDPTVNSNYSLDVWSDERLRIVFENEFQDNQEIFGTTRLEPGKLYHVAATFESETNTLSLFLNGDRDAGPTVVVGTPNQQNQALRIGSGYEGGPRTTAWGVIDDVQIWNRALHVEEIKTTMNKRPSGREAGLVGYWNFDERSGQVVEDKSPFKNDGTLGLNTEAEREDPVRVASPFELRNTARRDRRYSRPI